MDESCNPYRQSPLIPAVFAVGLDSRSFFDALHTGPLSATIAALCQQAGARIDCQPLHIDKD